MATTSFELAATERGNTSSYDVSGRDSLRSRVTDLTEQADQQPILPRADGGKQAWLFLAGCFMIEALIWGFPFTFGIFQEYYSTHPPFSENPSGVIIIGTTAMGGLYMGSPLVLVAMIRYPQIRRYTQSSGLVLMVLALVASSFATKVWHLVILQGILYAIAGSMIYYPTILYLEEWFERRRGFAYGAMWAGTGVSGIVLPLIMSWGLARYAFATMLRAWAVTIVVLAGPLLYFVQGRIPTSHISPYERHLSFGFIKTPTFWILQIGNIMEGLGFFMPNIYLPTYASELGASSIEGSLILVCFNIASVVGSVALGSLCDRLHVTSVILLSTIGSTCAIFFCWGMAKSLPPLFIFALVYGLSAGGFSSTWSGITQEVKKADDRAHMGIVFGFLAAGRGIGSIISDPLSQILLSGRPWYGGAFAGYGSGYGPLIVFTGLTAMLGGSSWVGRRIGWV